MKEILEYIKNGFKGMLIGIANAIPGVSGGTIAVVTGIYDRLIFSGTTLLKKDEVGFKTKFIFLATVVVGLLIGIFSGFIFLGELIDASPIPTGFFFFGLVLGSVPYLAKKTFAYPLKSGYVIPFILSFGLLIAMGLAAKPELGSPITELSLATAGLIFITGVFASAAMVIPGISGSFLMLLVGMYSTVSYAFRSFNIVMLGLFLLGALVGIVLVSLGISKVLKRYPAIAYWTILGLVQGSLVAIWPAIPFGDDILWSIIALGIGLTLSILLSSDKKDQAEESKEAATPQTIAEESKDKHQNLAVQKIQLSKGQLRGRVIYQSIAALVIFLATLSAWPKTPETYGAWPERDRPLVIAHQGGNLENPGNTMQAFQHAVDIGADALEFDIHLSSDGIPVVIHDDTVDRTTNGEGFVEDMNLAQLKALDAAYHWPFDQALGEENYPYRGRGVTIPTLEEVLVAFPDVLMAIEMKTADEATQTALGELLKKYNRWDKTIVGSFSRSALRSFRDEYPQALTSASAEESLEYYAFSLLNLSSFWIPSMAFFQVPEKSGSIYVLSEGFRQQAKDLGVRIQVWTPNTDEEFQRIIAMDVNGIITDRPSRLLRLLSISE
jgi:uncharacterized membrane protein/glycerophosphoryl diester phosphodiesterase